MTITKREYNDYRRLRRIESSGHVLTADGLRFICSAHSYDAEQIGNYFLRLLGEWNGKNDAPELTLPDNRVKG